MDNVKKKEHWRVTFSLAGAFFVVLIIDITALYFVFEKLFQINIIKVYNKIDLDNKWTIAVVIVTTLIVSYAFTFGLGKLVTIPVNKILNAMEQLSSGNYKERLSFKGPLRNTSTIINITNSFNKMASELEHTETLSTDFANNFSHEFKTPIVSIAGFAKLLNKGDVTKEQEKEYLKIIEEESVRLADMAVGTLNLMKIENQSILTNLKKYNLSEQIRNCFLLLENKWSKKQLDFSFDFPEYEVFANEDLLKQVWINLLDNAIKFTPEGESIKVEIRDKDTNLIVSITNTGITIPAENQSHIFNKFYQADESHSSEGSGIGLAIVKKVITLHNGNVCVVSGNNKTVFIITLPK